MSKVETKNAEIGIYGKFTIERTDGRSSPGEKHHGCAYFVLDLGHDPFAIPALRAYAAACKWRFPALSADLLATVGISTWGEPDTVNLEFFNRSIAENDAPVRPTESGEDDG